MLADMVDGAGRGGGSLGRGEVVGYEARKAVCSGGIVINPGIGIERT